MVVKTARMAEKGGNEPSQALPRQLPQGGSQAVTFVAKVLGTTRKLSGVLLALPLGELSPQVTERAHAVSLCTPSQALPRQLPQGGSQAVKFSTKVLGITRKLPAVLLPLPLGEVASRSDDGEGAHPLYDRIMNLYKHFCKGLDSRAKTVIMVLALRNKEC